MELFYSLLLGLIQGFTEFLPVSSSGHMLLLGRILGFTPSVAFEIVAHLGTLLAVLIAYRKELWGRVTSPLSKPSLVLVLSTAVTAVLVLIFEKPLRATFDGSLLPYAFLVTAVLLVVSSTVKVRRPLGQVGFFEGFIVGVAQAAAVVPGLSRSGTTMAAARLSGIDQKQSADFSFLLSVPIIIVSAIGELIKHPSEFAGENPLCLIIVFVSSFLAGYLAIRLVLKAVKNSNCFKFFAVYLILLSVFLFVNDFFLHLI